MLRCPPPYVGGYEAPVHGKERPARMDQARTIDLLVIALSGGPVSALEVARNYAAVLDARFAQVSIGESSVDGFERVRFGYVGISDDGLAIEGVVAVVSGPSGDAAVFDGFAPKGSLGAAIGDLREMVGSAEVV